MPNGISEQTKQRLQGFVQSERFKQLRPEIQKRLQGLLGPAGELPFVESKEPVFGAQQVLPESPVGPFGRFRLGLATPLGRQQLLEEQFGPERVFGRPGREIVATERGFQAVSPRRFELGDIPEALPRVPAVAGAIAGGVIGKHPLAVGMGAFGGELITNALGKALGARPDADFTKDVTKALQEGVAVGALDWGFGQALRGFPGLRRFSGKIGRGAEAAFRKVGKASKMTSDWFKERVRTVGAKEAFRPEKMSPEYGRTLLQRVQQGITNRLSDFTDDTAKFLRKFNVSDDTINTLKRSGYNKVKTTQGRLNNSTAELSQNIQTALSRNLKQAGDAFDDFIRTQPEGTSISSNNMLNSLRRVFKRTGVMNADNSFRQIDFNTLPRQIRVLRRIYDELLPGVVAPGKVRATGQIPISDYFRYKSIMDDAVTGGRADWAIFEASSGLVDDAVKSIKGLEAKNLAYSKAKSLHDDFIAESKTGEKVLDRFAKLTQKQKSELARLNKEIPFLDDLRDLTTAREIDNVIDKNFSAQRIESLFGQGASQTKTVARDLLESIDELFPAQNKFYLDYRDWLGHLDLQDVGAYTSRAGIVRSLSEQAYGKYLQSVYPRLYQAGRITERIAEPVGKLGRRVLEPQIGRFRVRPAPPVLRQFMRESE